MSTVKLRPPNAILFVFDRANVSVSIPQYVDGRLIVANASCASIATQSAVDGEVTVTLGKTRRAIEGMQRVFSGNLSSPGRKLAIVTAENTTVLECAVSGTKPQIEVWVDDDRNPANILVLVN